MMTHTAIFDNNSNMIIKTKWSFSTSKTYYKDR